MDVTILWIVGFVVIVIAIVLLVVFIELNRSNAETNNNHEQQKSGEQPRLGRRHEKCVDITCGPGLACTSVPGQTEPRCLVINGQPCLINQDCVSGFCQLGQTPGGVCQSSESVIETSKMSLIILETQIFCRQNEVWVSRITIPSELDFRRITSSNDQLLGISRNTNQIFLWNGSSWQDISNKFAAPGALIDGVIVGDNIWLVYRLPSGQTALYRLINGSLSPVSPLENGVQQDGTGQIIEIVEIDVHPSGEIFLVGRLPDERVYIFRRNISSTSVTQVTSGQNIFVLPFRGPESFAYSSGNSIIVLGESGTRQDNITDPITDLLVAPDNQIWYISNNHLFRNGQMIESPVPVNDNTRLFLSSKEGVCLFTPGF
jgi:hypothetical protein